MLEDLPALWGKVNLTGMQQKKASSSKIDINLTY
jgi:hypothetical protein